MQKILQLGLGLLVSSASFLGASPLQRTLETQASVSGAYLGGSPLVNPAALAYQTELNGVELLTAFSYGYQKERLDPFSLGVSMGYLGLSIEKLAVAGGEFHRYGISFGVPLSHQLYVGTRYRFTGSDSAAFDGAKSLDLGIQFRASPLFSVGLLAETINQPTLNQIEIPTRFILGTTIRPIRRWDLSVDVETPSNDFFNSFGYQAQLSYEWARGMRVQVGYHEEFKWQFGLQFQFANLQLGGTVQPGTRHHVATSRLSIASKPFPSVLEPPTALKVKIDNRLSEVPPKLGLFSPSRPSLIGLLKNLRKAKLKKNLPLVFIHIEKFPLGVASAMDVADAIAELRREGRVVSVFLSNAGLKEYLIAAAANHIYMEPEATLKITGLRSSRYYLKGTLDKVGVKGEFLAKGKYKSAPETFTRKESSELSRKETLSRLRLLEKELLSHLSTTKKISKEKWKTITRRALLSAEEAKEENLIDGVLTLDEAETRLSGLWVRNELSEQRRDLALPKRVAVIVASGDILKQPVRLLSIAGQSQITPANFEQKLKGALSDSRTSAVVIRISSPGGEILPSGAISRMIQRAREKKPVYVSMGDVAASGGYLMAAPAEKIFAQPTSLTGSIGVFLGKANFKKLYEKLDLRKEIISDFPHADLDSEDRPWTAQQRALFQKRLDHYYEGFTRAVRKHRRLNQKEIEMAAQGRVWLGKQAERLKLIDELGGYLDAVDAAAMGAGLAERNYEIWAVRTRGPLFNWFGGDSLWLREVGQWIHTRLPGLAREAQWGLLSKEPFLYLSPLEDME